jgi:UDP-N-acetylmuramoylalanine--D-glutamate ligase
MITVNVFAQQTVLVVGLARSGLAAVRALHAGDAQVIAWDDVAARRDDAALAGATILAPDEMPWANAAALVLSPGIPHSYPKPHPVAAYARQHNVDIIGDIELLVRALPAAQIIAITGTNGKSTTTALLGHVLGSAGIEIAVGGNLGIAALDLPTLSNEGIYVLEMSSYQLELTPRLACRAACLLNISADHLDRHGGMAGYIAAKKNIFKNLPNHGIAVVGIDDTASRQIADDLIAAGKSVRTVTATTAQDANSRQSLDQLFRKHDQLYWQHDTQTEYLLDLAEAEALPGPHNAQNAAAVAAIALDLGLSMDQIAAGLKSFAGLAHRQERVAVINQVAYINDSKATNADAAARALACYAPIYWIAGGRAKTGGIAPLEGYFPRIRHAYLIGEAANDFANNLAPTTPYSISHTLAAAVDDAHQLAQQEALSGATVLLAPAAASFDQFDSFESRGDQFRAQVTRLAEVRP